MSHILIAGLGDLGRGLAENLLAAGHRVSGIRRGSDAPSGVDLYSQDLLDGARLLPPDRVDLLVIIMTPSEYSEEGYLKAYVRAPLNLLDALAEQQPLPPILFVSSSAVFGDLEGDVDETTPPAPTRYNGKVVLAAEQEISTRGLTTVVRFSGIYGPGRSALDKVRDGSAHRIDLPGQVFSRIHVTDICRAVEASFDAPPGLYNIGDDRPASHNAVTEHASRLLGIEPPPLQTMDEAGLSPMARGFYAENRRVANGKAKRVLGGKPLYPDYKAGLKSLL